MSLSLLSRYAFFALCVLLALGSLPFLQHEWAWPVALVSGALSVVGIVDLAQTRQAVRRNYPVVGNIRYLVEAIRPEIRQYLLEGDREQLPFFRALRTRVPLLQGKGQPSAGWGGGVVQADHVVFL